MASSEEVAYPILRKHDVDYVLVIFGGLLGYSGDDINKFLWMVRIAQGVWPEELQEAQYFTAQGEYRVDEHATAAMKNSLMYKMSYYRYVDRGASSSTASWCGVVLTVSSLLSYRYAELFGGNQVSDRVRGQSLPKVGPTLDYLGMSCFVL